MEWPILHHRELWGKVIGFSIFFGRWGSFFFQHAQLFCDFKMDEVNVMCGRLGKPSSHPGFPSQRFRCVYSQRFRCILLTPLWLRCALHADVLYLQEAGVTSCCCCCCGGGGGGGGRKLQLDSTFHAIHDFSSWQKHQSKKWWVPLFPPEVRHFLSHPFFASHGRAKAWPLQKPNWKTCWLVPSSIRRVLAASAWKPSVERLEGICG